ncbi:30S ribosome-binding factor RbfA [Bacteriovoracaceae bacterium]|jgi:ribosome-binding factor A|nr:30S ribosome-binding factor RbfA [Bacteriovoracaceae bacterium]
MSGTSGGRTSKHQKGKYEERIALEINQFLRTSFSDPRLKLITVTHVELNRDMSVAKVWWDTFDSGKRGDVKAAITGVAGKLRSMLTTVMKVRHIPILNFEYNSQFEDEMKITQLLNTINSSEDSE